MILKILNLISFLATLGVNYFTIDGLGPFKSINNISNQYKTDVTPPDWTFGIWGLIYFGLLIFNIGQFFPKLGLEKYVKNINYLFILTCLFNISWLLIFSLGTKTAILCSIFIIIALMFTLLLIQIKAKLFKKKQISKLIFIDIPFGLYLGWVIFATIANIGTCIKAYGYNNIDYMLFLILLLIGSFLYLINLYSSNNYVTHIVYIYVLIALMIKYYKLNTLLFNTLLGVFFASFLSLLIKIILDAKSRDKVKNRNMFNPLIESAVV